MTRALRSTLLTAVTGLLLAGCVSAPAVSQPAATPTPSPSPSASPAPQPGPSTPAPACDNATQSYTPATDSRYLASIRGRGYVLVGVSADTRQLGAVDPQNPERFQGFDIDMARLVARAIFGDPAKIRFKVITTADRIGQLQEEVDPQDNARGGVDLVARAFTMTCDRWTQIAFSAEYLTAHQGLMVLKTSGITSVTGLAGKRVCAPRGSTSLARITSKYPKVTAVGVDSHTDCLVLLQEGRVDAITGDNAILAGFQAQDPTTTVTKDNLSDEPYGLGVSARHKDFAAYVNSVLATAVADGSWQKSYDAWLRGSLGAASPPTPRYGRP
jgi:polar amino acid transport system substrate-binding protein